MSARAYACLSRYYHTHTHTQYVRSTTNVISDNYKRLYISLYHNISCFTIIPREVVFYADCVSVIRLNFYRTQRRSGLVRRRFYYYPPVYYCSEHFNKLMTPPPPCRASAVCELCVGSRSSQSARRSSDPSPQYSAFRLLFGSFVFVVYVC